jgi:hypothetical protein
MEKLLQGSKPTRPKKVGDVCEWDPALSGSVVFLILSINDKDYKLFTLLNTTAIDSSAIHMLTYRPDSTIVAHAEVIASI